MERAIGALVQAALIHHELDFQTATARDGCQKLEVAIDARCRGERRRSGVCEGLRA